MSEQQLSNPTSTPGGYLVNVKLHSAKAVADVLSSLNIKKDLWVLCNASQQGLKLTVELEKVFQVSTLLKKDVFSDYRYHATTSIAFQFPLSHLIDCLHMYGSSQNTTSVQLLYPGIENTVQVLLTDATGVVTDCSIRTKTSDGGSINFHFKDSPVQNRVTLKSEVLKDIISEIDWLGEEVQLTISPESPYFEFKVTSLAIGDLSVNIPSKSDAFFQFESKATQSFKFKLIHFQHILKSLSTSDKTRISMNEQGVLCIQNAIKSTDNTTTYIEYFTNPTTATIDDDDMEEDDELTNT